MSCSSWRIRCKPTTAAATPGGSSWLGKGGPDGKSELTGKAAPLNRSKFGCTALPGAEPPKELRPIGVLGWLAALCEEAPLAKDILRHGSTTSGRPAPAAYLCAAWACGHGGCLGVSELCDARLELPSAEAAYAWRIGGGSAGRAK